MDKHEDVQKSKKIKAVLKHIDESGLSLRDICLSGEALGLNPSDCFIPDSLPELDLSSIDIDDFKIDALPDLELSSFEEEFKSEVLPGQMDETAFATFFKTKAPNKEAGNITETELLQKMRAASPETLAAIAVLLVKDKRGTK